ncbi:transcriptional regulator, HxlR family [Anaerosphaera aminiphila DSM 21120]|uniref:Transcriptional regulator, HxlR family n=1 Tax=Anaerosphaera aminiphila DSM 21120 TaxID=1120995 RepID=A0A1M5QV55_9FIRM|nr:helix-turn-helix domain-containing protein [Anaerosphaera aminiphila]SHH17423.1 transcriptional regulator, HxlR family [Anaerosphaera aminiphila DSM 21120]
MYERKIPQNIQCPIEKGLDIFNGKWKSRVLCVLARHQTLRYSEFKEEVPEITDTALTSTLKDLVSTGIITRRQYEEIPLKVEYSLTIHGKEAVEILEAIALWTNKYTKELLNYDTMPICSNCLFKGN